MKSSVDRVITVYNRYLNRGGEDEVFEAESDLLSRAGIEVLRLEAKATKPDKPLDAVKAGTQIVWSPKWKSEMLRTIDRFQPDVIHVHNWFPTMSPSIFWAAKSRRIPVVVTLHNFRLTCVRSTLFRSGNVCELCVGLPTAFWGVVYACYQSSRPKSAVLALGQITHRLLRTWNRCIDLFITPSNFAREVFIRASFPSDRIVVKPNFLPFDPGVGEGPGSYMFFAGRLSEEKGIRTLLAAAKMTPDIPFVIAGSGPLEEEVRSAKLSNVDFVGRLSREEVVNRIRRSRAVVIPSAWYESAFPLVGIEAFAAGRPVIASSLGAIAEGIIQGETGLLCKPNDSEELAESADALMTDESHAVWMGAHARQAFREYYLPENTLYRLLSIYSRIATKG